MTKMHLFKGVMWSTLFSVVSNLVTLRTTTKKFRQFKGVYSLFCFIHTILYLHSINGPDTS